MTDNKQELLDCPFCGEVPADVKLDRKEHNYIGCSNKTCHIRSQAAYYDNPQDAIHAWNKRPASQSHIDELCNTCAIGFILPSGVCDHCDTRAKPLPNGGINKIHQHLKRINDIVRPNGWRATSLESMELVEIQNIAKETSEILNSSSLLPDARMTESKHCCTGLICEICEAEKGQPAPDNKEVGELVSDEKENDELIGNIYNILTNAIKYDEHDELCFDAIRTAKTIAALTSQPPATGDSVAASAATNKYHDPVTGRYSYNGNFDRLCKCGHSLGSHIAGGFECGTNPGDYPETKGCACEKFIPMRKKAATGDDVVEKYEPPIKTDSINHKAAKEYAELSAPNSRYQPLRDLANAYLSIVAAMQKAQPERGE